MTTGEERTMVSVLECETITRYTRVSEGVRTGYIPRVSLLLFQLLEIAYSAAEQESKTFDFLFLI